MKLDRFVIGCGLIAGLIASGVAQDLASPPQSKLVIDRVNAGSPARTLRFSKALTPPRLIGEGGGACLLHYCDVNPVSVKPPSFICSWRQAQMGGSSPSTTMNADHRSR